MAAAVTDGRSTPGLARGDVPGRHGRCSTSAAGSSPGCSRLGHSVRTASATLKPTGFGARSSRRRPRSQPPRGTRPFAAGGADTLRGHHQDINRRSDAGAEPPDAGGDDGPSEGAERRARAEAARQVSGRSRRARPVAVPAPRPAACPSRRSGIAWPTSGRSGRAIPGFDRLAHGVVSLVRDDEGEVTGFAIEACGPAGERLLDAKGRTRRGPYALKVRGNVDALFRVAATGAEKPMIAYTVEGRSGQGGRGRCRLRRSGHLWLGRARYSSVIASRRNRRSSSSRTPGRPMTRMRSCHDRVYERGCDLMLEAGRTVMRAGPPPDEHKDIDGALTAGVAIDALRRVDHHGRPVELVTGRPGAEVRADQRRDQARRGGRPGDRGS